MPDVIDFIVLKQTYNIAMERNWSVGKYVLSERRSGGGWVGISRLVYLLDSVQWFLSFKAENPWHPLNVVLYTTGGLK